LKRTYNQEVLLVQKILLLFQGKGGGNMELSSLKENLEVVFLVFQIYQLYDKIEIKKSPYKRKI